MGERNKYKHKIKNENVKRKIRIIFMIDEHLRLGVIEYCATQRQGKSTLLTRDLVILSMLYPDCEIHTNFIVDVPYSIHHSNDSMIQEILKAKYEKRRRIIWGFDELSQVLFGRGYSNKIQIEVSSFLWQMPKREHCMLYTSNPGKSVDLIIRLATGFTVLPKYYHGNTREEDYIIYRLCDNNQQIYKDRTAYNLITIQSSFDTNQEIE